MKPKSLHLLIVVLLFCNTIFSQEKKDTIYFDEDWSICEKPVAEYYRVCTLNKNNSIFYKGNVEDYYLNGQLEMTGHYNEKGIKEGEFIFYSKGGDTLLKGNFSNNLMVDNWFFYNSSGKINTEINCKSEDDFTPILIIDKNGDSILKNGNGKFTLDMQNQLPPLLYGTKSYVIEGEVKQGLKDGTYSYYFTLPKKRLLFSIVYKDGKLKPGQTEYINSESRLMNMTDFKCSLSPSNLAKIDAFNHTNFVFEYNYDAQEELINFLLSGETPLIKSRAKNTNDNDELFYDLIVNVLYDSLSSLNTSKDIYYKRFKYPIKTYYSKAYSKDEQSTVVRINADIILTIDTSGSIINSAFNSNLTKQQINKINYYLGHISNLAPDSGNAEKSIYNVNIKLDMLIDTLKNDSFHISYLIYNADSVTETDLRKYIDTSNISAEDYDKVFTSVQVEAMFPGGKDAWRMYLERNLNNQTPADHGAPPGNYTVTVSFMVDENGYVSDVHALNNPGYGTAEEAVRIIKKGPPWKPAIQNGRNVKYVQKQNITFQVTVQ